MADGKNTLGDLRKEKKLREEILQQKIRDKASTQELTNAAQARRSSRTSCSKQAT